ncbi:hypothetical protein G7046_g2550 [Stylonectria norvegica]|nr:hypothetical protein G7046_g2550 [Stylonectria norvegica]
MQQWAEVEVYSQYTLQSPRPGSERSRLERTTVGCRRYWKAGSEGRGEKGSYSSFLNLASDGGPRPRGPQSCPSLARGLEHEQRSCNILASRKTPSGPRLSASTRTTMDTLRPSTGRALPERDSDPPLPPWVASTTAHTSHQPLGPRRLIRSVGASSSVEAWAPTGTNAVGQPTDALLLSLAPR